VIADAIRIQSTTATPRITIGDPSVAESNSGTTNLVFDLTLSATSGQAIFVNFSTADHTALAGPDYVAASRTERPAR
jgi:hypothetical protein